MGIHITHLNNNVGKLENMKKGNLLQKMPPLSDGRRIKRWVQTMDLRDNPELIAEYRRRHSEKESWPEILQGIRDCGLLEMEIYILGTRLVMICEAPEDLDWEDALVWRQGPDRANGKTSWPSSRSVSPASVVMRSGR